MIYQDLTIAITKTQKRFQKNPNSSISALFRNLRNDDRLSLIGDYPLIACIINTVSNMGISIKRSAIQWTIRNESEELKGQKLLLDQLFSLQITIRKSPKLSSNTIETRKVTQSLSDVKKRRNYAI